MNLFVSSLDDVIIVDFFSPVSPSVACFRPMFVFFFVLTFEDCITAEYRDLEIWVRGHSVELKLVPFEIYSIYGPASYHFRDKARHWSKIASFHTPPEMYSTATLGVPSEYCHTVWCRKTWMVRVSTRRWKKFDDISSRFDWIYTGVWRTDRQTDIFRQCSPR